MIRRGALGLVCALLAVGPGARANPLCAMSREQANHSPACVRYYFTCQGQMVPLKGEGIYANLSQLERQRLMLGLVFTAAEKDCDTFSYQEALAAMRAKIFMLEGRPGLLPDR